MRSAPTKNTDDAIESVPLVEIDGLTPSENEFVRAQHQELLRYARDNNDGNEVAFVFRKGFTERSEFLGTDDKTEVLTKKPSHNKNAAMLKFSRYIKKYVKNNSPSEYDRAVRKFIENSKEELIWQVCP